MIKVGICVAYDWELLRNSLPRIYESADIICLGLDQDRHAWSGKPFDFKDEEFFSFIRDFDRDKKIDIYEDDFSIGNLSTRENCNRQRMMIAQRMGEGGWHIQIDADEYFIDFKGFVKYLKEFNSDPNPSQKPINICCPFIPLIKKTDKGYLYVDFMDKLPEIIPMATNKPDYQRARQNGHFNNIAPFYVIHETWARGEQELWYKINNWGHASEELTKQQLRLSYFNLWKSLDAYNYQYIRNFHPAKAEVWPSLGYLESNSVEELISKFPNLKLPFNSLELSLKNNRNIARIKTLIHKVTNR